MKLIDKEKEQKVLVGWTSTTLWFKRGIDDTNPLEFKVLSPPGCSNKDYVKQIEKTVNQIIQLIKKFTNSKEMIIQGQYEREVIDGY